MATVEYANGHIRPVANLGYVMRRAYGLAKPDGLALERTFEVITTDVIGGDAVLVVGFKDGAIFRTVFQSRGVLRGWLDRPSFQGYAIRWEAAATAISVRTCGRRLSRRARDAAIGEVSTWLWRLC